MRKLTPSISTPPLSTLSNSLLVVPPVVSSPNSACTTSLHERSLQTQSSRMVSLPLSTPFGIALASPFCLFECIRWNATGMCKKENTAKTALERAMMFEEKAKAI